MPTITTFSFQELDNSCLLYNYRKWRDFPKRFVKIKKYDKWLRKKKLIEIKIVDD